MMILFYLPGAPYVPPTSSQPPSQSLPQVPSFQEVKPQAAWNDPPIVRERTKVQDIPYKSFAIQAGPEGLHFCIVLHRFTVDLW